MSYIPENAFLLLRQRSRNSKILATTWTGTDTLSKASAVSAFTRERFKHMTLWA